MNTNGFRRARWAAVISAIALVTATTAVLARDGGADDKQAAAGDAKDVKDTKDTKPEKADEKAAAEPERDPNAPPDEVVVGVYVNQVHEFSLRENSFTVDFYVWFRWKNPELKPYESFSVVDARIESQTEPFLKDLPNGEKYAYRRVVAKVTTFFDTTAYPFDNHQLAIIVEEEDSESFLLKYVADVDNSAASPNIHLSGWSFARLNTFASEQPYHSNFGDTSLPTGNETKYTRITTAVAFTREGGTFFFKLFFGLWICVLIAFLVFFIKPTDVDPRFGLGVGALFAAIASEYVVASALPDSNVITLADRLHLIAFFFIFVSIAQSTWSLWLHQTDREAASKRFDRVMRAVAPLAYVLANVIAIVQVTRG